MSLFTVYGRDPHPYGLGNLQYTDVKLIRTDVIFKIRSDDDEVRILSGPYMVHVRKTIEVRTLFTSVYCSHPKAV